MNRYLRAGLLLSTALGFAGMALGQSSSPFSGWFGSRETEGPVALDLRVTGDEDDLERMVRNTSQVVAALAEGRVTGQDILAAARADYARILGALYDQGHYSALIYITLDGVEAAEIAPLDAPATVARVVIAVDPGPTFQFSRAAIGPLAPDSEMPREYAVGETAGTGTIKAAAVAAVEGWRDASHAKADVSGQEIVADHNQNSVDSQIVLAPGPAVTFGKLNMTGYERMKPRRLHKIAGLPEGEPFDPEEIEDVRKRLRRSGVFSAITLEEADQLGPDNSMDVNLTVVEQKQRSIGGGFELSNNDGLTISAYWMHRNLLGGGERLRIEGEATDIGSDTSDRDEELTFRLDRPATITADTTAYLEAKLGRLREEDYDSDSASLALGFNHIVGDELTVDIAMQYQVSRVNDQDEYTDFRVLAFPAEVTWDKRDEPTDAKRGFYLQGEAMPYKGFNGTDSGTRLLGEGRAYYSLGEEDRFTLAGRARLGTILGAEIQNTPREYLFYSGGGGSVRGQAYQSLGVNAIMGRDGPIETGGMSLVNASAELRYQLREKIGVVAFADYGRVWAGDAWSGSDGWQAGAGAGVRYKTPIGPLRFDIAAPVGGGATDDGIQVYLGLGQAF
ncbi:autotransporter assembly complex protein TamA [Paracoccus marinaquae]|uniref:Autotransporter assembly complex protein TamA n=1 Tax=Paracoccus marinaquae TaxID=2841926 RepID=A0ABS6AEL1_9RHOB|nr:autotransporter assembly complex family protein [Paracoccus marinaquae]MBU3029045.1 autotransporter assembly complex protein TamA [Paracoccus marinaquae]